MASLNLPKSENIVRVRAIDTTCNQVAATHGFLSPVLKGFEELNLPTLAFLVENEKLGKRVLFDCGGRKDYTKYHPNILEKMDEVCFGISVDKEITEILEEADIDLNTVDSMIWSHWHFDHHGAPDLFPKKVEIVTDPGFKKGFMPGFPTNPNAILSDSYFEGREVREITFDGFTIGRFPAYDYFGDGSFYLLDSPGHAVGHICGLARTTPDTFVFSGGDICHSPGAFRPTRAFPLPDPIPDSHLDPGFSAPCPCSVFTQMHPSHPDEDLSRNTPFFKVYGTTTSLFIDVDAATKSIEAMKDFEESSNVLACISHDVVLVNILPLLNKDPKLDINDWKTQGYKEKARWYWLNELPRDGKPAQPRLVDGIFYYGENINSFAALLK